MGIATSFWRRAGSSSAFFAGAHALRIALPAACRWRRLWPISASACFCSWRWDFCSRAVSASPPACRARPSGRGWAWPFRAGLQRDRVPAVRRSCPSPTRSGSRRGHLIGNAVDAAGAGDLFRGAGPARPGCGAGWMQPGWRAHLLLRLHLAAGGGLSGLGLLAAEIAGRHHPAGAQHAAGRAEPLDPGLLLGLVAVVGVQFLFVGSAYPWFPCSAFADIAGALLIGLAPLMLAYLVVAALATLLASSPEV